MARALPETVRRNYERTVYAQRVAAVGRLCRAMARGLNMTEACRDPQMPARSTMVSWLGRHPELAAEVERTRAQFPEAQRREYHTWSEAVAEEFLERIADGRGLREVCAEPDMPVHGTVLRWLAERPEFARRYALAREAQADRLFDLAWTIACEAGEGELGAARLKIATLKWRVGKLAPWRYGPLRASAPAASAAEASSSGGGREPVRIEVRHFALRPDGKVVDITTLARGLRGPALQALYDDVESGRLAVPDERDW